MLKQKIFENVLNPGDAIAIDQSRCLRMRFNKNSCNKCMESCYASAIAIDEGVSINIDACSECMMCASVCPAGGIDIRELNFDSTIARLRTIRSLSIYPVLSCNVRKDLDAHEKTHCLGFLSEEHIMALMVFMHEPLQINLTRCAECRNGFIADAFKKRLENVRERTSLRVFEKIKLVEDKSDLDYQDIPHDRRGFFKTLKNLAFQKATCFFDDVNAKKNTQTYSDKALPFKRELLNRLILIVPDKLRREMLRNYYYDIDLNEDCNDCFACVGMCPTGALKADRRESNNALLFNSSLCNGCGLCEGFCMNNSIHIKSGFSDQNPFDFGDAMINSKFT